MNSPKFVALKDKPGWARSELAEDRHAIEDRAKSLNLNRPPGTYFVCGHLADDNRHHLYRIETGDALEIVRAFRVGTHAASYVPGANSEVIEELALVHSRNPIVPFFADVAGLKCTFERPIEREFADFLDDVIAGGIEAYADEGCIAPIVMRDGYLQLWWD